MGGVVAQMGDFLPDADVNYRIHAFKPGGERMVVSTNVASAGFAVDPQGPVYFATESTLQSADVGLGSGASAAFPPSEGADYRPGIPTVSEAGEVLIPIVVVKNWEGPPQVKTVEILSVSRDWQTSRRVVYMEPIWTDWEDPSNPNYGAIPYKVFPDGKGGLLATFTEYETSSSYSDVSAMVTHVAADGTIGSPFHAAGSWSGSEQGPAGETVIGTQGAIMTTYDIRPNASRTTV